MQTNSTQQICLLSYVSNAGRRICPIFCAWMRARACERGVLLTLQTQRPKPTPGAHTLVRWGHAVARHDVSAHVVFRLAEVKFSHWLSADQNRSLPSRSACRALPREMLKRALLHSYKRSQLRKVTTAEALILSEKMGIIYDVLLMRRSFTYVLNGAN